MPNQNKKDQAPDRIEILTLADLRQFIKEEASAVNQIDFIANLDKKDYKFISDCKDPRIIGQYLAYLILLNILNKIGIEKLAQDRNPDDPRDSFLNTGETKIKEV